MSSLSRERIAWFCKPGGATPTCRYLAADPDGVFCAKFDWEVRSVIDARSVAGTMKAKGANCEGIVR